MVVNGGANGRDRVYIVDSDGANPQVLVDEPGFEGPSLPVWSPGGTKLAFVRTPGSSNHYTVQVWVMSTDGADQIKLYESPMDANWEGPFWSPDGSRVTFRINRSRRRRLVRDLGRRHRDARGDRRTGGSGLERTLKRR
jgi:Tol biopolymer transport system component